MLNFLRGVYIDFEKKALNLGQKADSYLFTHSLRGLNPFYLAYNIDLMSA